MQISGWGNYPVIDANLFNFHQSESIAEQIHYKGNFIPRGLGRSYGDSSLSENILSSSRLNRFLGFDQRNGILHLESGVSLKQIIEIFLPKGFFLPVTPGTKHVTIGGAIASDVHGKNHHKEGTFSEHVLSITLLSADGRVIVCSRTKNHEIFYATCSGMGLTGLILDAHIKLKKIDTTFIQQKTFCAKNLDQIMDLFEQHKDYTYSVAWIDGIQKGKNLGRSVLFVGEHASPDEIPKSMSPLDYIFLNKRHTFNIPFFFPPNTLNSFTINLFNFSIYNFSKYKKNQALIHLNNFFYPLDFMENWNRLYGKRGFVQYQFVLPFEESKKGLMKILSYISSKEFNSFLGVLKLFGPENKNLLSFPMKGYNLALDFPIKQGLFIFLDTLDKLVLDFGGRIYLTKDARLSRDVFQKSYKNHKKFIDIKRSLDRKGVFQSLQSKRIGV